MHGRANNSDKAKFAVESEFKNIYQQLVTSDETIDSMFDINLDGDDVDIIWDESSI